jgi:hypothetical protein
MGALSIVAACSSSSGSNGGTPDASTGDSGADTSMAGPDGGADTAMVDASEEGEGGEAGVDAGPPASITITSPLADGGTGIPSVVATTNASGQVVVPIDFTTTHFTLAAPGMCGTAAQDASDDHCGFVEVFVDGASCGGDGGALNSETSASPAEAILSQCPIESGSHTASLELHHGDGSPILDPANSMTIAASLTFDATVHDP